MAACSASGTMAVRYGTMKTAVLGLTVVLANGDIIKTGTRAKKLLRVTILLTYLLVQRAHLVL